ncbi:methyl-accepting chemotaxis protein [Leptothrix sp. BB-4]
MTMNLVAPSPPELGQPTPETGASDTAEAPARPAPAARGNTLRNFFRYHGIYAPGVRVMRALSVRGKATLLAGAFVLPLVFALEPLLLYDGLDAEHVTMLLAAIGTCLALAIYMLMSFYRVTHGGLAHLKEQVGRMATGDLSMRPQPWGRDEVAHAMHSLGQSLGRLADLFAVVRQGVAASSHASREIAAGNHDLARRTADAAAAIDQVLAGVGQYIEQLDASGLRVDEAEAVVQRMRLDAAHARHQMAQLDARMQALQQRSREIVEIVALIDNLAFRTNILALNASIEAAKAGEAGRGFAVVAQEVRSLAGRSAESARRIGEIISGSTDDIAQGHVLAGEASQALRQTDSQVSRIHDEMQQIVALTRAGQNSSQEILAELRRLGELTQENHRLVDQMATASNALSAEGDRLDDTVAGFKLV